MRTLIVGCGYIGFELAKRLLTRGHKVWGLTRTNQSSAQMEAFGVRPLVRDLSLSEPNLDLPSELDVVVNCASTRGGDLAAYQALYATGIQRLIRALKPHALKRYVMVSSTSVYGQCDGDWVTEESETAPQSETSKVLVTAENSIRHAWRDDCLPAIIIRAGAIYGPGRGHLYQQFLHGEARLTGDGARWLNMVHRDDLVSILESSIQCGQNGETYNAVDDEPVTELRFFQWLSTQLDRPMPPKREGGTTPRKRGSSNKRVSNRKAKERLCSVLNYPTFREGYSAKIKESVRL